MKMKSIITTIAALALGISASQAGRGTTLIVPGTDSQLQHASHAKHTFDVGEMYSYTVNSVSYSLTTMDASSTGNKIVLTITSDEGTQNVDLTIPLVRKEVVEGTIVFNPPLELTGEITMLFDFQHSASAYGAVALNTEYQQSAPEASGKLIAPAYANTEDCPNIDWSALISVKTETGSTDVSGAAAGADVEAVNGGTTETTPNTSPGNSGSAPGQDDKDK